MGKFVGQIDEIHRSRFRLENNKEEREVYKRLHPYKFALETFFTELTSRMPCSTSDELCTRISVFNAGERNTVYFGARTEDFGVGAFNLPVESNSFIGELNIDEQASRAG
jgi:hypothetical protein